jgi:hypothetical protein
VIVDKKTLSSNAEPKAAKAVLSTIGDNGSSRQVKNARGHRSLLKNCPWFLCLIDLLGRINTVNLEHVLGEIQTNRGDLHMDGSLM